MKEKFGKLLCGIVLLFMLVMAGALCVSAEENGQLDSHLWYNCSNVRVQNRNGCEPQKVYQYCPFYVNLWNPSGEWPVDYIYVEFWKDGICAYEDEAEWTGYYASIPFYFEKAGVYEMEVTLEMSNGETLTDTSTVTVNDVAECGSVLTVNPDPVAIAPGESVTLKVHVSGILPKYRSFWFSPSDPCISCQWWEGNWYDTDGDGETDTNDLIVTGVRDGTAEITLQFLETGSEIVIATRKIPVTVATPPAPAPTPGTIQVNTNITKEYAKNKKFSLNAKAPGKLTYTSTNKKVATVSETGKVTIKGYGKTKIQITMAATANYTKASATVSLSVVSGKVKLKSASSKKKGVLSFSWKKNSNVDGYDIQYSTDPKFKKKVKKGSANKRSVTSGSVKNLKRGKVYYVRVRGYNIVNGKKITGNWCKAKRVKIK